MSPGDAAGLDILFNHLVPRKVGIGGIPLRKHAHVHDMTDARLFGRIYQGFALRKHGHRLNSVGRTISRLGITPLPGAVAGHYLFAGGPGFALQQLPDNFVAYLRCLAGHGVGQGLGQLRGRELGAVGRGAGLLP
nr:hypothetical protein [Tanacetum cinerariifolium]